LGLPIVDKSGSCAIVVFLYGDTCYTANVGDSRAIMSSAGGQRVSELSLDHKPSDDY
jgi:protein phosphatase 2C family protein 2/3